MEREWEREAEQAQETEAAAMSCQPFREWWLTQGRVCRWKNSRMIRERCGSLLLSLDSSVLYVYLVCLLAAG